MADGGGGSAERIPIYDRVQSQAESLAADRARLAAADRVQRESWDAARRLQRSVEELQAAARDKDAEINRLRAEAADARKKLQADAGRNVRWEAAYVELLLGASQKLADQALRGGGGLADMLVRVSRLHDAYELVKNLPDCQEHSVIQGAPARCTVARRARTPHAMCRTMRLDIRKERLVNLLAGASSPQAPIFVPNAS